MVDLRPTIREKIERSVVQSTRNEVKQSDRQIAMSNNILSAVQQFLMGHIREVDLSTAISEGVDRHVRTYSR